MAAPSVALRFPSSTILPDSSRRHQDASRIARFSSAISMCVCFFGGFGAWVGSTRGRGSNVYNNMCICILAWLCIYIYIYIYNYVNKSICIYIYIYIRGSEGIGRMMGGRLGDQHMVVAWDLSHYSTLHAIACITVCNMISCYIITYHGYMSERREARGVYLLKYSLGQY